MEYAGSTIGVCREYTGSTGVHQSELNTLFVKRPLIHVSDLDDGEPHSVRN